MSNKITVDEGQILVESVDLVTKRRGLRVWHIEMHSKYAETMSWDNSGIDLIATEHTLKWNRDSKAATHVELPIPKDWEVLADLHARYSIQVVAWKPWRLRKNRRRGKVLWMNDDDNRDHSPDHQGYTTYGGDAPLIRDGHEPTGVGWG
jgi:hypothetical protein